MSLPITFPSREWAQLLGAGSAFVGTGAVLCTGVEAGAVASAKLFKGPIPKGLCIIMAVFAGVAATCFTGGSAFLGVTSMAVAVGITDPTALMIGVVAAAIFACAKGAHTCTNLVSI